MSVYGERVSTAFSSQHLTLNPENEDSKFGEEEEKNTSKEGRTSLEYLRVEDVFIVPAVGTFQEDFDLDSQEYCLSCCTTPRPTMHGSTSLGRNRKIMTCPNCLARIKTYTDHGCRRRALGYSWVVPFVGFCCTMYAMPCFHTVRHYCPQCSVFLGQHRGMLTVKERKTRRRDGKLMTEEAYKPKDIEEGEEKRTREEKRERKKIRKGRKRKKKDIKKEKDLEPIEQQEEVTSTSNKPQKLDEDSSGSDDDRLQRHNRPSEYGVNKARPLEDTSQPTSDKTDQEKGLENDNESTQSDGEPKRDTPETSERPIQKEGSPIHDEKLKRNDDPTGKTEPEEQEENPKQDEKEKPKGDPIEKSETRKQNGSTPEKDEHPKPGNEPPTKPEQPQSKQSPKQNEETKPKGEQAKKPESLEENESKKSDEMPKSRDTSPAKPEHSQQKPHSNQDEKTKPRDDPVKKPQL